MTREKWWPFNGQDVPEAEISYIQLQSLHFFWMVSCTLSEWLWNLNFESFNEKIFLLMNTFKQTPTQPYEVFIQITVYLPRSIRGVEAGVDLGRRLNSSRKMFKHFTKVTLVV